jgi:hypothetical protein
MDCLKIPAQESKMVSNQPEMLQLLSLIVVFVLACRVNVEHGHVDVPLKSQRTFDRRLLTYLNTAFPT